MRMKERKHLDLMTVNKNCCMRVVDWALHVRYA